MDFIEAVLGRKSIRGYMPDPVPKDIIQDIIQTAVRAPSAMNTQPWEITVATGEPLENIKNGNIETLTQGKGPKPGRPMVRVRGGLPGPPDRPGKGTLFPDGHFEGR